MSQPQPAPKPPAPVETRAIVPTWIDYFLVLAGVGLSLFLTELVGLRTYRTDLSPGWMTAELARILPHLLLLPVGIMLWWPLFFMLGRLRGRPKELTRAEWLWGLVWLADLFLVGLITWSQFQAVPEFMDRHELHQNVGSIMRLLVLALAAIAVLLAGVSAMKREPVPWTHHFGLALLLWPMLPLLVLWLGRVELHL
jgi:Na+/proline symporter